MASNATVQSGSMWMRSIAIERILAAVAISAAVTGLAAQQPATGRRGGATAQGTDWPGWRGANRDARSPDTGLLRAWPQGGPRLVLTAKNLGPGFSSVAVTGGRIYT